MGYVEDGISPDFADPLLALVWAGYVVELDKDGVRWDSKTLQRQYAVFCREAPKFGVPVVPFEAWKDDPEAFKAMLQTAKQRLISADDRPMLTDVGRYPNTITNTNTITSTNTSTSITGGCKGADKPPRHTKFVPPSVEEVLAYITERGCKVDAGRFVDFYTANGWMIGKTKMKDWKASVRYWERNEKKFSAVTTSKRGVFTYEEGGDIFGG